MYPFSVCLVLLSSLLGTISGVGQFTKTPPTPIEVEKGNPATFEWTFLPTPPLRIAYWVKLDSEGKVISPYIMVKEKYSDPAIVVRSNTEYANRVQAISAFAMQIRETKLTDDGMYRFSVIFQDFHTIQNDVRLIVLEAPKINIRSPSFVQVGEGTGVQLDCGSTQGNPKPLTFFWKKKEKVITSGKNQTRFDLRLNNTGRPDIGVYECTASNKAGSSAYSVTLDVLYRPVVVALAESTPVREDGQTFVDCLVEGNPNVVTYEWYRDITLRTRVVEGVNIKLQNNNRRLVFEKVPRKLGGAYYCVGRNSRGIGKPKQTVLNVMYPPGAVDIPSTNGAVVVTEGQNVTIKCNVDANPKARFTWLRRGYLVKQNSLTGDLTIPFVNPEHAAIYTCQAANLYGQVTGTVKLDVRYGPRRTNFTVAGIGGTYVTIKDRPANLSCETDSNPISNYLIRRLGTTQSLGNVKGFYYIPKVSEIHEGKYECVANNNVGSPKTAMLTLIVAVRPSFINLGANQPENVREGTQLEISCTVKSKPAPELYWHLNDVNLTSNDTQRTITISHFGMQGLETRMRSLIRINVVRRIDSGTYKCIAENLAGVASRVFNLNVQYPPYLLPNGRPANYTTFEKRRIELKCLAKGNPPLSFYKWTLNGRVLNNFRGPDLIINQITKNDAGVYTCNGVNLLGDGEVATSNVNVLFIPEITVPPTSVIVNTSANVVLRCQARGYPVPTLYWFKNDRLVKSGGILQMNKVGRLEKGRYTCVASNYLGNGTASATVLVRHAPFIVSNTPSFTKVGADLNRRATLTCTVDAYPTATLKWKLNTVDIISGQNGYEIQKDGDTSYLHIFMSDASRRTKYICEAKSRLGMTSQEYEILPKGAPEPPVADSFKATDTLRQTDPPTSDVRIQWTPGFNGGYSIETFLYYREKGTSVFQEMNLGTLPSPDYTVRRLKAGATYEFSMRVRNPQGLSKEYKPYFEYRTKTPPPARATASVEQYGSSGTDVIVKWTLIDPSQAEAITINYKKVNAVPYQSVPAPLTQSTYVIRGLEKGTTYEFQVLVKYKDGTFGWPVGAGKLIPGGGVAPRTGDGLSKNEIIAIVVAIGGFLVLLIICVALFIFRRKNKGFPKRDPRVEFTTAGSVRSGYGYATGGSDVVRTTYMEEDAQMLEEKQANSEKRNSPPPKYTDVHYYNGSLDSRTNTFQPRNPVGNTPAYSSLSRSSKRRESDRGADIPSKAPSHTSLSSNRAAEITRTQRNPLEMDYGPRRTHNARENPQYASDGSMDNLSRGGRGQKPRPGVENPRYRPDSQNFGPRGHPNSNVPVTNLDFDDQTAQYNANGGRRARGSSSGGPSTDENLSEHEPEGNEQMLAPLLDSTASDEDMPVPPPFLRDAIRTPSDSERVPGSLGAAAAGRIGQRKPPPNDRGYTERPYYPERQSYNDGRTSPQAPHSPESSRSGTSSRPYRSDNEYIDDPDDSNYVGYLV